MDVTHHQSQAQFTETDVATCGSSNGIIMETNVCQCRRIATKSQLGQFPLWTKVRQEVYQSEQIDCER